MIKSLVVILFSLLINFTDPNYENISKINKNLVQSEKQDDVKSGFEFNLAQNFESANIGFKYINLNFKITINSQGIIIKIY